MENHPIPQDVTSFQFKLIGNMTVRQFAYLITGVILAAATYQMNASFLIKFPICAFFAGLGAALAFLPVSGRPMDTMIGNYLKALIRPTVFIYDGSEDQDYSPTQAPMGINTKQLSLAPKDKLKIYIENLDTKPKNKADEKEENFLLTIHNLTVDYLPYRPKAAAVPSFQNVNIKSNLADFASPQVATKPTPTPPLTKPVAQQQPIEPKKEIAQSYQKQTVAPEPILSNINKATVTIATPTYPNLITGAAKDARGNALPNILVEIRDKDDSPIRAFKTNEIGRFASATPLANGTYTIYFEDPKGQNKFKKTVINATGLIIPPIEAISVDMREELRRSLFAPNNQNN